MLVANVISMTANVVAVDSDDVHCSKVALVGFNSLNLFEKSSQDYLSLVGDI